MIYTVKELKKRLEGIPEDYEIYIEYINTLPENFVINKISKKIMENTIDECNVLPVLASGLNSKDKEFYLFVRY